MQDPYRAWGTGTPSASRLGKFLVQAQFQGSVHSSALFLTAAAQNLLCLKLAGEVGVAIPSPWLTWFKAAIVPAVLGLLITPLVIFQGMHPTGSIVDFFYYSESHSGRATAGKGK